MAQRHLLGSPQSSSATATRQLRGKTDQAMPIAASSLLAGIRRLSVRGSIAVAIRVREHVPVSQRAQKRNNLVFFFVGESEIAGGGIDVVRNFGRRPAG